MGGDGFIRRRRFLALGLGVAACAAGCGTARGTGGGPFSITPAGEPWTPLARTLYQAASREGYRMAAGGTPITVTGLTALADGELNHGPATLETATPLARLTGDVEVVLVPADSRYRDFDALAEHLVAQPLETPFAGGPVGGPDHLLAGLIARGLGADTRQLDYTGYPGAEEAAAALLGGRVAAAIGTLGDWRQRADHGKVRALAVSSAARVPGFDAPSLLESGVRVDFSNWCAAVGPPGMSGDARDAALAMVDDVCSSAPWLNACHRGGWRPFPLAGDDFGTWLTSEIQRTRAVLRDLGLSDTPSTTCWGSCGDGH